MLLFTTIITYHKDNKWDRNCTGKLQTGGGGDKEEKMIKANNYLDNKYLINFWEAANLITAKFFFHTSGTGFYIILKHVYYIFLNFCVYKSELQGHLNNSIILHSNNINLKIQVNEKKPLRNMLRSQIQKCCNVDLSKL